LLKEFKEFVRRGNVLDMAVGITIGAAFGAIVQSLVADVLMPPLGLLFNRVDFANMFVVLKDGTPGGPYVSLALAKEAGAVTLNYGQFVNTLVRFIIISIVIFYVVRTMNRLKRKEQVQAAPNTKICPFCRSSVDMEATRCPYCTSELT
jgi:large conductance mechanosensitive channel